MLKKFIITVSVPFLFFLFLAPSALAYDDETDAIEKELQEIAARLDETYKEAMRLWDLLENARKEREPVQELKLRVSSMGLRVEMSEEERESYIKIRQKINKELNRLKQKEDDLRDRWFAVMDERLELFERKQELEEAIRAKMENDSLL